MTLLYSELQMICEIKWWISNHILAIYVFSLDSGIVQKTVKELKLKFKINSLAGI